MGQFRQLASPRSVTNRNHCTVYHSIDPPSGPVGGQWDLHGRPAAYGHTFDCPGDVDLTTIVARRRAA